MFANLFDFVFVCLESRDVVVHARGGDVRFTHSDRLGWLTPGRQL